MLDTQNQEPPEDVRGRCCGVGLRQIRFKRVAAPIQYAFRQHISSLIAQRDVLAMTGREMFQDHGLEAKLSTLSERKIHLEEHFPACARSEFRFWLRTRAPSQDASTERSPSHSSSGSADLNSSELIPPSWFLSTGASAPMSALETWRSTTS